MSPSWFPRKRTKVETFFWVDRRGKVRQTCRAVTTITVSGFSTTRDAVAFWILLTWLATGILGLILSWLAIRIVEHTYS